MLLLFQHIEKEVIHMSAVTVAKPWVAGGRTKSLTHWYENLTTVRELSPGTAVRHFNVMHHMMKKAATIWSKDTGIDRNPADQVEVKRPDDHRDRYLSEDELRRLKVALDEKIYRKGTKDFNRRYVGSG
jgi:hypothetical protein